MFDKVLISWKWLGLKQKNAIKVHIMFKYNKITIFVLLSNLLLLLNACNPNSSQITIYTTDIDEVKKGEIVDIPM